MTIVVDASVALKWVIEEDGSQAALALIAAHPLVAPELLAVECANVLWAKARRGALTRDLARTALDAILATPVRLLPSAAHVSAAQTIAFDLDQTAYDSLYLAVALAEHATFITADERFVAAASGHGVYALSVQFLQG